MRVLVGRSMRGGEVEGGLIVCHHPDMVAGIMDDLVHRTDIEMIIETIGVGWTIEGEDLLIDVEAIMMVSVVLHHEVVMAEVVMISVVHPEVHLEDLLWVIKERGMVEPLLQ